MSTRADRNIFLGLAIAIVIVASVSALFYASTTRLIVDADRVEQTHHVIHTLGDFYSALQDVRISTRAYVLQDDPRFLKVHNRAMARVRGNLAELRRLTAGDSTRQSLLDQIEPMAQAKLKNSDDLIDTRRRFGRIFALGAFQRQLEDDISDDLRGQVTNMVALEHHRLSKRAGDAQSSSRAMLLMVVFGSLAEVVVALAAALAIRRHIKQRQLVLESLRQSESTLSSFYNSGVIMMGISELLEDENDVVMVSANAAAAELFGLTSPSIVGCRGSSLAAPDKVQVWLTAIRESIGSNAPVQFEQQLEAARGARWLLTVVCPIAQTQAGNRRFSYVMTDITVRKTAEEALNRKSAELLVAKNAIEQQADALAKKSEQLELARRAADASSAAKSTFLANMSHEIRTPMTSILGYAEMMLEPDQSPAQRQECVRVIRRSARHLLELINDILDLSKIEAGRMELERSPTNPAQAACEVVSMLRPRAIDKRVQITLRFDSPIPDKIATDPLRLRQVLMNLVGNSIKFTDAGEITVQVGVQRRNDSEHHELKVDVTDTGIGMSGTQIARLFQPFCQVDPTMTRRFGGSGLGLAISRRLVEMLGGHLTVQSTVGHGSTFSFTIDAGDLTHAHWIHGVTESTFNTPASEKPAVAETALHGRILLAEDGKDNQRLIATHLQRAGAQVEIVENGNEAVRRAISEPYDLILLDMQMPDLDGYGAASELRQRGVTVPIVALTAHAMTGDRERCLRAGCSDYLSKPVDRTRLLCTIAAYLNGKVSVVTEKRQLIEPAIAHRITSEFAADPQMLELIDEFVCDLPRQIKRINELMAKRDLDALRRVVHQLKGAGGGYGFAPITQIADRAEHAIKSLAPLDQVRERIAELIDLIQRIEGYTPISENELCLKKS